MKVIKVAVQGALGKMGQEVVRAVASEPDLQLVGAIDIRAAQDSLTLPNDTKVPLAASPERVLTATQPDVLVDFTVARATMPAVRQAAKQGVNLVIGTTGLSSDELEEIDRLAIAHKVGAVVASNFALGAVIMIHLAKIAGKYLDHAEIIELHHDRKLDAPSGTSLSTAKAMVKSRGKPFLPPGAQGEASIARGQQVEGVNIHSVRLPGLLAHQEIIFGVAGQTLSIRHDTISRECYMPGVILAIKEVTKRKGLVYGLDTLLGL